MDDRVRAFERSAKRYGGERVPAAKGSVDPKEREACAGLSENSTGRGGDVQRFDSTGCNKYKRFVGGGT